MNFATIAFTAFVTLVVVVGAVYLIMQLGKYKTLYEFTDSKLQELMGLAMKSEADKKYYKDMYEAQGKIINDFMGKPVLAALQDMQIQQIAHQVTLALIDSDLGKGKLLKN